MTHSKSLRTSAAVFVLLGLFALQASPASAAKDRFYRTKPHVNVSASSVLTGGGTQAHPDPNDPWKVRPKTKCDKDGNCKWRP